MPNVWALKGDAFVIGLEDTPGLTPVRLAATQSDATIHRGTNMPAVDFYTNPGIDSPELATSSSAGNPAVLGGFGFLSGQTHSSVPPVYLAPTDIHLNDARTHGASHKILTNFMYTWGARKSGIPLLCIGQIQVIHISQQGACGIEALRVNGNKRGRWALSSA